METQCLKEYRTFFVGINDDCQIQQIASDDILKATTNLSSLKKKPETEDMEIMMTATLSSPA
jgi:hypothetical protein